MCESKKINAWVAVDKDSSEFIYTNKPDRDTKEMMWLSTGDGCIPLPKGSIKALIGRELSWESESVQLTENNCDGCEYEDDKRGGHCYAFHTHCSREPAADHYTPRKGE